MREGWRCPSCSRILAPHMDFCDCGGSAGVTTVVPPITPSLIPGTTVTTGTTWPTGGTVTTTWRGTTLTYRAA